jgi:hypothetical protein
MTLSDICQKAKTVVVLVVCFSRRCELRWHPHMDGVHSGLEDPQPQVYPLSGSVEELWMLCIQRPTMVPEKLPFYIIDKIMSVPVPFPKAAVAWLQFVCWQVPHYFEVTRWGDKVSAMVCSTMNALFATTRRESQQIRLTLHAHRARFSDLAAEEANNHFTPLRKP